MLPTEYILSLIDTSGEHKAVAQFHSMTPFTAVNVGDRFDDTGWQRLDGVGVIASPSNPLRYTVHSIKHLIEKTDGNLIVSYCLNLEPFTGSSSPVWPDAISQ